MDTKSPPIVLLSTINRYQVSDHLAWGSHTPLFVAIRNLANVTTTHLGNQSCHETIYYPGILQDHDKAVQILLLLSTHTL